MTRSLRLGLALVAVSGCFDTLDTADKVHDLRLLAFRAEPPEQLVTAAGPVTVTALVADPSGGGRAVSCHWSTCAQLDSSTSRCETDSPGFAELGQFDVSAGDDGAEPALTYSPDPALLTQIGQLDPYRGLGGLRQIVQLEIAAGEERVVGLKRVVFRLPMGGAPVALNHNPVVGELQFNDAGWAPDASVAFVARPPRVRGTAAVATKNQVAVLQDKSLLETYQVTTFDGQTRELEETWRYNLFATHGGFSPATAGGNNLLDPDAGVEAQWQGTAGDDGGTTTVWVVVRDGRGGETWAIRHAEAPPTLVSGF